MPVLKFIGHCANFRLSLEVLITTASDNILIFLCPRHSKNGGKGI